eukprot:5120479-Alexandrium_andersonii.AAC.1
MQHETAAVGNDKRLFASHQGACRWRCCVQKRTHRPLPRNKHLGQMHGWAVRCGSCSYRTRLTITGN